MRAVHVVAAAIIDAHDRVLIAQRLTGKHLAGGWEFPGGKLEPGEPRRAALARELHEELGIEVAGADMRPLMRITHPYPTRLILLDTFVVRGWHGEPRGLEGQPLRWCPLAELGAAGLLPADAPIVAALRLPERLTEPAADGYQLQVFAGGEPAANGGTAGRGVEAPGLARGLRGALCADASETHEAARRGAGFVALSRRIDEAALRTLCESIPLPVYARDMSIEGAWDAGATGVNELP